MIDYNKTNKKDSKNKMMMIDYSKINKKKQEEIKEDKIKMIKDCNYRIKKINQEKKDLCWVKKLILHGIMTEEIAEECLEIWKKPNNT